MKPTISCKWKIRGLHNEWRIKDIRKASNHKWTPEYCINSGCQCSSYATLAFCSTHVASEILSHWIHIGIEHLRCIATGQCSYFFSSLLQNEAVKLPSIRMLFFRFCPQLLMSAPIGNRSYLHSFALAIRPTWEGRKWGRRKLFAEVAAALSSEVRTKANIRRRQNAKIFNLNFGQTNLKLSHEGIIHWGSGWRRIERN